MRRSVKQRRSKSETNDHVFDPNYPSEGFTQLTPFLREVWHVTAIGDLDSEIGDYGDHGDLENVTGYWSYGLGAGRSLPRKTGRARGGPTTAISPYDWLIEPNRKGIVRISGIVNFPRSALSIPWWVPGTSVIVWSPDWPRDMLSRLLDMAIRTEILTTHFGALQSARIFGILMNVIKEKAVVRR
jgi:hypothetical protein